MTHSQILFGTSSGHVYALSGNSGLDIANFPFRTHGRCDLCRCYLSFECINVWVLVSGVNVLERK